MVGMAACSAPPQSGSAEAGEPHPDTRFLVDYGGKTFRVNVRYVELLGESVIAVRKGQGDADPADWRRMTVKADVSVPRRKPFGSDAYRRVAVDIADAVRKEPPICADDRTMRIATDEADSARTMFREKRDVWVVFALCPSGPQDAT